MAPLSSCTTRLNPIEQDSAKALRRGSTVASYPRGDHRKLTVACTICDQGGGSSVCSDSPQNSAEFYGDHLFVTFPP